MAAVMTPRIHHRSIEHMDADEVLHYLEQGDIENCHEDTAKALYIVFRDNHGGQERFLGALKEIHLNLESGRIDKAREALHEVIVGLE